MARALSGHRIRTGEVTGGHPTVDPGVASFGGWAGGFREHLVMDFVLRSDNSRMHTQKGSFCAPGTFRGV